MVYFDGLDITKEIQYFRGVPDLALRGISCLIIDGPGNGESIRFRGFPLDYRTEKPASAVQFLGFTPPRAATSIHVDARTRHAVVFGSPLVESLSRMCFWRKRRMELFLVLVFDRTVERSIKSHADERMFDLCYFSQTRDSWRAWKKAKQAQANSEVDAEAKKA